MRKKIKSFENTNIYLLYTFVTASELYKLSSDNSVKELSRYEATYCDTIRLDFGIVAL